MQSGPQPGRELGAEQGCEGRDGVNSEERGVACQNLPGKETSHAMRISPSAAGANDLRISVAHTVRVHYLYRR